MTQAQIFMSDFPMLLQDVDSIFARRNWFAPFVLPLARPRRQTGGVAAYVRESSMAPCRRPVLYISYQ